MSKTNQRILSNKSRDHHYPNTLMVRTLPQLLKLPCVLHFVQNQQQPFLFPKANGENIISWVQEQKEDAKKDSSKVSETAEFIQLKTTMQHVYQSVHAIAQSKTLFANFHTLTRHLSGQFWKIMIREENVVFWGIKLKIPHYFDFWGTDKKSWEACVCIQKKFRKKGANKLALSNLATIPLDREQL